MAFGDFDFWRRALKPLSHDGVYFFHLGSARSLSRFRPSVRERLSIGQLRVAERSAEAFFSSQFSTPGQDSPESRESRRRVPWLPPLWERHTKLSVATTIRVCNHCTGTVGPSASIAHLEIVSVLRFAPCADGSSGIQLLLGICARQVGSQGCVHHASFAVGVFHEHDIAGLDTPTNGQLLSIGRPIETEQIDTLESGYLVRSRTIQRLGPNVRAVLLSVNV